VKEPHAKLIELAARRHLAPIGLHQRGRSRSWIDDRRWYAIIVEFQPSGLSKGTYLNVGAHFLWRTSGHSSFDLGYRVQGFVAFESEAQFAPEANRLAAAAAIEVERLRALLPGVQAAVTSMPSEADDWLAYHRAIALGLSGNSPQALEIFVRLGSPSDPRPWEANRATLCLELQRLLPTPAEFRAAVVRLITQQRHALRLSEIADPFSDTDAASTGAAVH
jgi:hypothetical protein